MQSTIIHTKVYGRTMNQYFNVISFIYFLNVALWGFWASGKASKQDNKLAPLNNTIYLNLKKLNILMR